MEFEHVVQVRLQIGKEDLLQRKSNGLGADSQFGVFGVVRGEVLTVHFFRSHERKMRNGERSELLGIGRARVPAHVVAPLTQVNREARERVEMTVHRHGREQDAHGPKLPLTRVVV